MEMTGRYVDGFVLPVPRAKLDIYREHAAMAAAVWKEHGALEVVECVGDEVPPGKVTSFPQAVLLEADEIVVFSWIVHASREARDRTNAAVMADPRIAGMDRATMPFDGRRMIWGGFRVIVPA
jgi:uncharacterized protein YbaA (DUF1428 family)